MTLVRVGWLAAALLLGGVPSGSAQPSGATRAAAPFADAWAKVPASPAARKAAEHRRLRRPSDFTGFNTVSPAATSSGRASRARTRRSTAPTTRTRKGDWFAISSRRRPQQDGRLLHDQAERLLVLGRQEGPRHLQRLRLHAPEDRRPERATSRAARGTASSTRARFTHRGDKQVTFFWKTTNCSTDFPCGPFANWQSLFGQLYPSFALAGLDFNKIWTDCICGNDGRPVSDGPFYLSNYSADQGTTLKANPYYYAKPKLAEVDFKFILDPNAEEQAMLGGQVDAITPSFGPVLLPLKGAPASSSTRHPATSSSTWSYAKATRKRGRASPRPASNVLLRAPWMREAIMLGIDRQRIINAVFGRLAGGMKPLDNALFFSTQTAYRPDFQRWNYDPAKALAILKKHCVAGSGPSTPSPANTKIWQCAGLPATFNWTWAAGRDDWTTSEQIASGDLRSIGIGINERPLPQTRSSVRRSGSRPAASTSRSSGDHERRPRRLLRHLPLLRREQLHRLLQSHGRRAAEGRKRRARSAEAGSTVPEGGCGHGHAGCP